MMSQTIEILYVDQPKTGKLPYKRVIYAGVRQTNPTLLDKLYIGSKNTIEQEILSEELYPCLIVWENESSKERKYAEVNRKPKKVNRAKSNND